MSRRIAAGIDIGTHNIYVVVCEGVISNGKRKKRIIGSGVVPSRGLRHGYVINPHDATKSIREAVRLAEKQAQHRIKSAHISVGGISLEGTLVETSVAVSRADAQITELDTDRVLDEAERSVTESVTSNRRIVHSIPVSFKIDKKEVLGNPIGMKGVTLDAQTLLVTCLEQHLQNLIHVVEDAGIEVDDIIAAPLAAGVSNLTKTQKIAGVVLANIGAETVSMVVYENNTPLALSVFPIGSTDITNDIALGLQVPIEEAESIKVGRHDNLPVTQKKLDDIIAARLTDILELIEKHLKKIKRNGLLPAGIVVTGGGAQIPSMHDLAKAILKLPAQTAELVSSNRHDVVKDPAWSIAYGLAMIGLTGGTTQRKQRSAFKRFFGSIAHWLKQFLP